jgi:iron complex outermembrane receptor protein
MIIAGGAALLLNAPDVGAQEGSISGVVLSPTGEAATDAEVRIVVLGRVAEVDRAGRFAFENVPVGQYLIQALSPRHGAAVERVAVDAGATMEVTITCSVLFHVDDIIVTAGPQGLKRSELLQPANVLSGRKLTDRQQPQLGDALAREPGINATYFGPGSSRPVIRGLQGDRVRVLESGIGTGDASDNSPDHAVAVEPSTALRIEVLRGPATLIYGGSAIGGIVNVIDGRIPFELPTRPFSGFVEGLVGSVANELNGKVVLNAAAGRVAFHGSFLGRHTGDYSIPGFADADHDHEQEDGEVASGVLSNSAIKTLRGDVGVSWIGQNGYLGVALSGYASDYGIPVHGDHEHEEEGDVSIDLDNRRFDFAGAWRFAGFFQELRGRAGFNDYRHFELLGEEPMSVIDNERFEARIEAQHKIARPLDGTFGFQYFDRDFGATGEEAFAPPTDTKNWAAFLYERIATAGDRLSIEVGARYESQAVHDLASGLQREFGNASVSGGANWRATDPVGFYLSLGRNAKFPSAEQLFSDGPHPATRQFEVGDPTLKTESSLNLDVAVQAIQGPVTGSATFFVNSFKNFIYQKLTGEEEDGLPVAAWTQEDARFSGFEIEADVEVFHRSTNHIILRGWTDYVRAELTRTEEPVPRMPPLRFGGGVRYDESRWRVRVDVLRATEQDRISENETPTPGYTMLDASVAYRFFTGGLVHDVSLLGTNLTDELARNSISFIKDQAPLPGRDVRIVYRLSF